MEKIVNLKIEQIFRDDGSHYFLATSDDVQGLVAQGSTLKKVIEIAEDLTKLLFELDEERKKKPISPPDNIVYYPLAIKI